MHAPSVCIPDDKKREQHQKIQNLHVCKLAVLLLLSPYLVRTYVYALHHSHNRINCTVILIFCELHKLRSLFYSYFMLNYTGAPSLAKL